MEKWLNTLGLAYLAKLTVFGDDLLLSIRNKQVSLVIIAQDIGESSLKKLKDKCAFYGVEFIINGTKQTMAWALGKGSVAAVGITAQKMATKIKENMKVGESNAK